MMIREITCSVRKVGTGKVLMGKEVGSYGSLHGQTLYKYYFGMPFSRKLACYAA